MWIPKEVWEANREEVSQLKEDNRNLLQALLDSREIPVTVGVESAQGRVHYMDDEAMVEAERRASET